MSRGGGARYFDTATVSRELKRRTVVGSVVSVTASVLRVGLQLGLSLILVRLLAPSDLGLIAMVTPLTTLLGMLNTVGLATFTVQRPQISHEEVSTLFWIGLATSAATTVAFMASAPLLVWIYDDERVAQVTVVLASAIVLQGLANQHLALLSRQMMFARISMIELGSLAAGVVVAIVTALGGAGYWAIVASTVATSGVRAVLAWLVVGWFPSWPRRERGLGSALVFGGYVSGFQLVNYFGRNADNMLLGWRAGSVELGFYAMSYRLLVVPLQAFNQPLGAVAIPALSRLVAQPDEYRAYFRTTLALISLVSFPLSVFTLVMSPDLVHVFFGDTWQAAAPILSVLSIVMFLHSTYTTMGWVFLSTGRSDRMFAWACIAIPSTVVAFLLGLPWGAMGVAAAYAIANAVLFLPGIWFATIGTPLRVRDVLVPTWRPALVAAAIGGLLVGISHVGATLTSPLRLSIAIGGTIVVASLMAALLYGWRDARRRIVEVLGMFRRTA